MCHKEFEVREATRGDVDSVVALSSRLFLEDAGTRDTYVDTGWTASCGRRYFSDVVSDPESLCFVAEVEGSVVGYLVGRSSGGTEVRPVPSAELESMYVLPESRGRGVGTALVRGFFRWAESRGLRLVSVTAYHANASAVAFYESLGFTSRSITLEWDISRASG